MRGKDAARNASGQKAQENAEDGGQKASGVYGGVGVGKLPTSSVGGSR